MKVHQMKLALPVFQKVALGKKVIESRLFDKKRQLLSCGDKIIFRENDEPEKYGEIEVVVEEILHFKTFAELFSAIDPAFFGGENSDFLWQEIKQFYSDEEEEKFGVVGIRFRVV